MARSGDEYFAYRIPGLVALGRRLVACFECRRDDSDWARIDLKVLISDDGGESWKESLFIPGDGHTMNNPTLIADGEKVHLLYCRDYKKMFHTVSADGGNSWENSVEISYAFENCGYPYTVIAVGPGHGIKTQDGTLVASVWLASNFEDPKAHKPSVIGTVYSKDCGKNWAAGDIIISEMLTNPSECALGVRADGVIVNSIRNENAEKSRWQTESRTGYSDWTALREMKGLPDPTCQASLIGYDGKLYFVNCASEKKRERLTLKVSEDGFESFKSVLLSDIGGYSDITVCEGKAYVIYEKTFTWHIDALYLRSVDLS